MKSVIKKISNLPSLKTKRKLVIFMSDDWGAVRIKSLKDQEELIAKGLKINNRFDKFDTLETNKDIEELFNVLLKHKDSKGNHPIISAVTNVGNPDFNRIKEEDFQRYSHESIDATYDRYPDSNNVLSLVRKGIQENIFVPQFHGREHLQVNWWMQELKHEKSFAREAFENQFYFIESKLLNHSKRNRGVGAAFDVWDNTDIKTQKEIVSNGLSIFKDLYGYEAKTFTPPAMYYNPSIESTVVENGVEWIDVGRFYKIPLVGGKEKYQFNYLGRKKKSGLKVIVRNAVFESNFSDNDNGVARCMKDIEQAFKDHQPAIISNHRASFVGGIDENNRDKGLRALDLLFGEIITRWGDVEFINIKDL